MNRPERVTLTFEHGPWDGQMLRSDPPVPETVRLSESIGGVYRFRGWTAGYRGRERARYTWQRPAA